MGSMWIETREPDPELFLMHDARTLAVGMPSPEDPGAESHVRLGLQRLVRSRDDVFGASCWMRSATGGHEVFAAEGDVGDPVALRAYVGVGMATIVAPGTAIAPLHSLDGSTQGVVMLRGKARGATPFPFWPIAVGLVALLGAIIARARHGRPLDRIAGLLPRDQQPRSIVGLASQLVQNLGSDRITSRIERQVRVRTRELEQLTRHRDEHVATTAHELRTPLTVVMASVEMVRDGYATSDTERQQFLDQAATSGEHMMLLLNDLLDRAAIEAGKLRVDLQDCFVDDLVADALRVIGPAAIARETHVAIKIAPDVERPVRADPGRVLQVVFNLVSNALKYSSTGSPVTVRVVAQPEGACVEIEDHGMGIPPEAARGLFQRFNRVHDAASSTASGTGIGLHVSKALVEGMGGEIGYRPRADGQGSVFWFRLGWSPERPSAVTHRLTKNAC